jgi:hypothetical protein
MCKYHKHAGFGDAIRIPAAALRRMGGRTRRVSRHDIPADG